MWIFFLIFLFVGVFALNRDGGEWGEGKGGREGG